VWGVGLRLLCQVEVEVEVRERKRRRSINHSDFGAPPTHPTLPPPTHPPTHSALGDFAFKHPHPLISPEPAVRSVSLTPADALLLMATDGVTDVLGDDDALGIAMDALTRVCVWGGVRELGCLVGGVWLVERCVGC